MTTITASPQSAPAPADAPRADSPYRLSFGRLVHAEWIKFTTLRSTWWSFGLVALVGIGLSVLLALAFAGAGGPPMDGNPNTAAVQVITFSTLLTQLLAVIVGTITVTGEYSTGMIRSTLTAAPGRVGQLLAKALVVFVTMFVFNLVVFAAAALASGPILPNGMINLGDPETSVLPLLGAALFLALVAVLGVGVGFIIRNGPGALAAGIGLIFVLPVMALFFPRTEAFQWVHDAAGYLPSNAGQSLFMGSPMSGILLEPWPAIGTIVVWALLALVGGLAVVKSRDA